MKVCKQYHDLLSKILKDGVWRDDPNRKETKRLQIPFHTMSIDLREGFPMLTTKQMWWKGIVIETLWLLKGESSIKELIDQGVNIWNKDAYNYSKTKSSIKNWISFIKGDYSPDGNTYLANSNVGNIGRMYGVQWRRWPLYYTSNENTSYINDIDQLQNAITTIKENPLSSNIRIFGDNPADANDQALPCCMDYMQFVCSPMSQPTEGVISYNHYLDLTIHYRSSDVLLGLPWNIAQYALILEIIAKIANKVPRHLNIVANNVHLYDNQIDAAKEQLKKDCNKYSLPELKYSIYWDGLNVMNRKGRNSAEDLLKLIEGSLWPDFKLINYESYPKLINQPEMKSYE